MAFLFVVLSEAKNPCILLAVPTIFPRKSESHKFRAEFGAPYGVEAPVATVLKPEFYAANLWDPTLVP